MFLHFLKIIRRHLLRNKWLSFLKLLSLTLGLCAFIIVMVVNYSERTWDQDWPDAESIYILKSGTGLNSERNLASELSIHPFKDEMITGLSRTIVTPISELSQKQLGEQLSLGITDIKFFNIFKPKIIKGDLSRFDAPDSIVISQFVADKLFGNENSIGNNLGIVAGQLASGTESQANSAIKQFKVIAVIENPSARSSISTNLYISNQPLESKNKSVVFSTNVFIKLNNSIKESEYENHVNGVINDFFNRIDPNDDHGLFSSKLLSIIDIHLDKDLNPGKDFALWILYSIAASVLLVSLVNYINLVISSQLKRQKEFALYRLTGSSYINMFFLFFTEALLYLSISLILTLAITQPLLPWLFKLLAIQSDIGIRHFGQLWLYLFCLLSITSLLLAALPLYSIKHAMLARTLSANQYSERKETRLLRHAFLCFQFFSAACFGIAAGIMSLQIHHALNIDRGYSYKNILQIHFQGFVSSDQRTALIQELKQNSNILAISRMAAGITSDSQLSQVSALDTPKEKSVGLHTIHIADFEVFDTYSIKIIAGSLPKNLVRTNYNSPGDVVLCKQSLSALGFTTPEEAIDQKINFHFLNSSLPLRIVAVTDHITAGGLLSPPINCLFWNSITPDAGIPFSIKYKEGYRDEALNLKTAVKKTK